jgi:hypothetical protein
VIGGGLDSPLPTLGVGLVSMNMSSSLSVVARSSLARHLTRRCETSLLLDRRRTGRRAAWSSRRVRAGRPLGRSASCWWRARRTGLGLRKGYRPRAPPLRRSRASATDGRNGSQHLKTVHQAPVGNEDSALRYALNECAHPCIFRQLIDTSQISALVVRGKGHKARFSLYMGDWDDGHREQAGSRIT